MKYIREYLADELKIMPLGELTLTAPSEADESTGYSVCIDGNEIGLTIWWADYAFWLERKLGELGEIKIKD